MKPTASCTTSCPTSRERPFASGSTDLSEFFQQWLYQGGWLDYEGGWRYDSGAGTIEVELNQVQDGYSFKMPVQLGIYAPDGSEVGTELLQVNDRTNRFTISVDGEPGSVVLDPDTWVLMDADFVRRN